MRPWLCSGHNIRLVQFLKNAGFPLFTGCELAIMKGADDGVAFHAAEAFAEHVNVGFVFVRIAA